MINRFDTISSETGRRFDFIVESNVDGKLISVCKCILFEEPVGGITNMALVDVLENGDFSDTNRSGHRQADMIFATVAETLLTFLIDNPDETVSFRGSDPEGLEGVAGKLSLRQKLYNRHLSKKENYDVAINYFTIYGVYGENIDSYKPNSSAQAFLIQLKN